LVDGEYVPVQEEQGVIRRICETRAGEATWQAVADALNDAAVPTPSGAA
jgi:IS5 family transposase